MPTIEVAIPTRNRAIDLNAACESLHHQTLRDFTVLISDNASTDHGQTEDVANYWTQRDQRFVYLRQKSYLTLHEHYDYLWSTFSADFIHLLADDDALAPSFLEEAHRMLEASPLAVLAMTAIWVQDAASQSVKRYRDFDIACGNWLFEGHAAGRQVTFLSQNSSLGTVNLVQGVYRKSNVPRVKFAKLSTSLDTAADRGFLYACLGKGPVLLSPKALYIKTQNNTKWYEEKSDKSFRSQLRQLAAFLRLAQSLSVWPHVMRLYWPKLVRALARNLR